LPAGNIVGALYHKL